MIELTNVAVVTGTENTQRKNTTKHSCIRYTGGLHEGGHCAALHHVGIPIREASINVEKMIGGFICSGEVGMIAPKLITREVAWRITVARMAGYQAIVLLQPDHILSDRVLSRDDYDMADQAVRIMAEEDLEGIVHCGASFNDEGYEAEHKRTKKALIAAAEQEAAAIIRRSRAAIIALGRALADEGRLSGEEIAGITEREQGA